MSELEPDEYKRTPFAAYIVRWFGNDAQKECHGKFTAKTQVEYSEFQSSKVSRVFLIPALVMSVIIYLRRDVDFKTADQLAALGYTRLLERTIILQFALLAYFLSLFIFFKLIESFPKLAHTSIKKYNAVQLAAIVLGCTWYFVFVLR